MKDRQVWFITRPERDPKFHEEALKALYKATNGFIIKWSGNREVHKNYERELANLGVKRNKVSNDGSGGRTWFAMLKTFAYCYIGESGNIILTKIGKKILSGEKVYKNIKKQVLSLQIPNAYFLDSGFRPKFDPKFRIRPVLFLIRLANSKELDFYITKEEITFFALPMKKDSDITKAIKAIVNYRHSTQDEKEKIKDSIALEVEHRERADMLARDFYTAHSDVAHTFMLISDYTGLVEYIRGHALRAYTNHLDEIAKELKSFQERYPYNNRYLISLSRMMENNGLDVDSYKAIKFGSIKPAANKDKTQLKIENILSNYPNVRSLEKSELINILTEHIPYKDAEEAVEIIREQTYNQLSPNFVERYLNETDNYIFEDKTGQIFKALGFDVRMRPSSPTKDTTEIEILLKYGDGKHGIIDAKNYKEKFALSASLASHMASEYIPNYQHYEGSEIEFFGYITANEFSGEKNLEKITQKAKAYTDGKVINGVVLKSSVLLGILDYCIENDIPIYKRPLIFLNSVKNKGFKSIDTLLNEN